MASMQKIVVQWNGFTGAPGYSSLFFKGDTLQSPNLVTNFFSAYGPYIPSTVHMVVPNNGELVDPSNGQVTGTWTLSSGTDIAGTGTGAISPTEGPQVRWETGQFRNGKHIRGRTYFVPMGAANFATGGILNATMCNVLQQAADTLRTSSGGMLGVWHRPKFDHTQKPPVLVRPGEWIPTTSSVVPTKSVSLRSRRD